MNFKKTIILSILVPVLVVPFISFSAEDPAGDPAEDPAGSQTPAPKYEIKIPNPLRSEIRDIPSLLNVIIKDIITPIGGIVAVLMIMYSGFLFVTAQGDTTKIKTAREMLLYTAIGAAILLGANLIATAIQSTINQLGA